MGLPRREGGRRPHRHSRSDPGDPRPSPAPGAASARPDSCAPAIRTLCLRVSRQLDHPLVVERVPGRSTRSRSLVCSLPTPCRSRCSVPRSCSSSRVAPAPARPSAGCCGPWVTTAGSRATVGRRSRMLRQHPTLYQLVLTNTVLPDMDGGELAPPGGPRLAGHPGHVDRRVRADRSTGRGPRRASRSAGAWESRSGSVSCTRRCADWWGRPGPPCRSWARRGPGPGVGRESACPDHSTITRACHEGVRLAVVGKLAGGVERLGERVARREQR